MSDSCPKSDCESCASARSSLSGNSCCWVDDTKSCYVSYNAPYSTDCIDTKSECPGYSVLSTSAGIGIGVAIALILICIIFGFVIYLRYKRTNTYNNNPQPIQQNQVVIQNAYIPPVQPVVQVVQVPVVNAIQQPQPIYQNVQQKEGVSNNLQQQPMTLQ